MYQELLTLFTLIFLILLPVAYVFGSQRLCNLSLITQYINARHWYLKQKMYLFLNVGLHTTMLKIYLKMCPDIIPASACRIICKAKP